MNDRTAVGQPLERRRPITIPEVIEYGTTPAVSENIEHSFGRDLHPLPFLLSEAIDSDVLSSGPVIMSPLFTISHVCQAHLTPISYLQLYYTFTGHLPIVTVVEIPSRR